MALQLSRNLLDDSKRILVTKQALLSAGQGLNTGLEDGAVLAWHMQQGGLSAASMRAFEKERIPRVQGMAKQEYVSLPQPPLPPHFHSTVSSNTAQSEAALSWISSRSRAIVTA